LATDPGEYPSYICPPKKNDHKYYMIKFKNRSREICTYRIPVAILYISLNETYTASSIA